MRSNHPAMLRQDWVSYAGTGRSVLGTATRYAHGRPGPILTLTPEHLDRYCRLTGDADKLQLYDTLSSGDEQQIRTMVERVVELCAPAAEVK